MAKRSNTNIPNTEPVNTPHVIEVEIKAEEFSAGDYEILVDWSTGNEGEHSIKEIFDILDRVLVGGYRNKPFIYTRDIVTQMMEKIGQATIGPAVKN